MIQNNPMLWPLYSRGLKSWKGMKNTRKEMRENKEKFSNHIRMHQGEMVCLLKSLVWIECSSQGGFMHPYSHTFWPCKGGRNTAKEEEPSSNSRNEVYTQATRVLPSMRSHLQQAQLPEGICLRIIGQIQWYWACRKSLDVYSPRNAHFLHLDHPSKSYSTRTTDCQKLYCISVFYFVAEVYQPNELQIKRDWSC